MPATKNSRRRNARRRTRYRAIREIVIPIVAALMFFGICLLVRALQPKPLETAEGYVAAPAETAVLYDEEGQTIRKLPRGSKVTYVVEEREEGAPVRIVLDEDTFGYLKTENLTDNVEKAVTTGMVYACTVINLTDKSGAQPGALTEKGMALNVLGYDGLQSDGSVVRYRVQTPDGEGYIRADNVSPDEAKAKAQANEKICAIHASRSDKWGGGDAAGLDYATYEKGDFSAQGNTMPDEVKALYLNNESITRADDYIEMAKQCAINAFVVDIVDGGAIAYDSPVMKEYCPSAYKGAYNTAEDYRAAVQKLKDAGYYVIGRITAFNDPNLAEDHPECVIADRSGKPMEIGGMYWPSVYSRFVWQYKVELALEAVKDMGFNEIQFDYTRFPDGTWEYDDDAIDYRNTYGESKAQAVQRFLLYARERLHEAGVYLSADVFGECAEDYVTAYGQYWAAISGVVDAISAMPYPDHYGADGDYLPWEHPYDTLKGFGAMAAKRQKETACPAAVRTWIQAYNAIREPYNTYGPEEVAQEIQALRDTGNTGGYMTWNGASDLDKYYSLMPAFD